MDTCNFCGRTKENIEILVCDETQKNYICDKCAYIVFKAIVSKIIIKSVKSAMSEMAADFLEKGKTENL